LWNMTESWNILNDVLKVAFGTIDKKQFES